MNYVFYLSFDIQTKLFGQRLQSVSVAEFRLNFRADLVNAGVGFLFRLEADCLEVFFQVLDSFDQERLECFT